MKRLLMSSIALLSLTTALCQKQEIPMSDYAVVTGECTREFLPDELYLCITIRERDSKGKISIEEQQAAMMESLKKNGIGVENLKVEKMATTFFKKGQNLAYGSYELKLSSPEELYISLEILDRLGISDSRLNRIDRSDKEKLRREVLAGAMKNARARAEAIAATEGLTVGKCTYFTDDISAAETWFLKDQLAGQVAGVALYGSRAPVQDPMDKLFPEIGALQITAKVTARFKLE